MRFSGTFASDWNEINLLCQIQNCGQVLAIGLEEFQCEMLVDLWNHRIVGVGKDLWTSLSPIPDTKASTSVQVAQDYVHASDCPAL